LDRRDPWRERDELLVISPVERQLLQLVRFDKSPRFGCGRIDLHSGPSNRHLLRDTRQLQLEINRKDLSDSKHQPRPSPAGKAGPCAQLPVAVDPAGGGV